MVRRLCAAIVAIACALSPPAASGEPARRPTLDDLTSLYDLGGLVNGLAISPDGSRAAIFRRATRLTSDDYQYDLVVIDLAPPFAARIVGDGGGWVHRRGRRSGAALDRLPVWSPDGQSLAYLAERDGHVELWISSADGRRRRALVEGPGDVTRLVYSSPDELVFEMGPARARLEDERRQQENLGFAVDDRFEAAFALRPRDRRLEGETPWSVNVRTRRVRAATDPERRALDAPQTQAAPSLAGPLNTADTARAPIQAVWSSTDGDARMCASELCRGVIEWAYRHGDAVILLRMEDPAASYSAIYRWDLSDDNVRMLRRTEDKLFDCQMAARQLVCLQEATLQPRRVVTIDTASGAMTAAYDPNPQWHELAFTPFERIDVQDAYGNDAYAHLFYPDGYDAGREYPLVVVQYRSRGFLRGGTGGEYPIVELARRGYFVLSVDKPEWRTLATQQTAREITERTELDHSERHMKLSAIAALIENVRDRGLVDPDRVAITGLSDGAETLYWSITHSELFAVAVVSTPPIDAMTWHAGSERFRRQRRSDFGDVSPWAQGPWARYWREVAPFDNADLIRVPIMMQLADAEALPAFGLYARLREANHPIEFYIYPGEYHLKWRPRHIRAAQQRALDWIDFWLQGIEREAPAEPGRLERWRAMRAARDASR
jgi:dipeptidyl aminopeptidase/acylaminoacyl peptidase